MVSSQLENLTTRGIEGGDNKQNHQSAPLFKPEIIVRIVLFLYLLSFHTIDENGGVVVKPDVGHHDGDGDGGDGIDGLGVDDHDDDDWDYNDGGCDVTSKLKITFVNDKWLNVDDL